MTYVIQISNRHYKLCNIILPPVIVVPGVEYTTIFGTKLPPNILWYPVWSFLSKRYLIYGAAVNGLIGESLLDIIGSDDFKKTYIDMIAAREHIIESILSIQ